MPFLVRTPRLCELGSHGLLGLPGRGDDLFENELSGMLWTQLKLFSKQGSFSFTHDQEIKVNRTYIPSCTKSPVRPWCFAPAWTGMALRDKAWWDWEVLGFCRHLRTTSSPVDGAERRTTFLYIWAENSLWNIVIQFLFQLYISCVTLNNSRSFCIHEIDSSLTPPLIKLYLR